MPGVVLIGNSQNSRREPIETVICHHKLLLVLSVVYEVVTRLTLGTNSNIKYYWGLKLVKLDPNLAHSF